MDLLLGHCVEDVELTFGGENVTSLKVGILHKVNLRVAASISCLFHHPSLPTARREVRII